MNILHTETLKGWGGQQGKVLKELLTHQKDGHMAHLVCNPNSEISKRAKEHGIRVSELTINKKNYIKTIPWMLRYIRENQIDLAISHGSTDSWIVAISGLISNLPAIRERHNEFPIKGVASKWLHQRLFKKILVVSDNVKTKLVSIGVDEDKIVAMPSVIDVDALADSPTSFKTECSINENERIVGYFSSAISIPKGSEDFLRLIKKLAHLDNLCFVIVGKASKQLVKHYQDECNSLSHPPRIIWAGFRNDIANVLKSFDVGVYPSHTEGMPNALLEQMACSIPVVTYDIPPMNQLVQDGETGLCAAFGDIDSLAECVIQMLANENQRRCMGTNAHEYVKKYHHISSMSKRFDKLFEELCS